MKLLYNFVIPLKRLTLLNQMNYSFMLCKKDGKLREMSPSKAAPSPSNGLLLDLLCIFVYKIKIVNKNESFVYANKLPGNTVT